MKKLVLLLVGIALLAGYALAADLEYFQVYAPKEGMSADEIMQVEYFVKYTKFLRDVEFYGKAYLIDKSGATRERGTLRQRVTLGRKSDGLAYKDLNMFTSPVQVKGMATLSWTYMDPKRQQDIWIWLPSLKKIRKVSAASSEDSFMGSDFSVEDILTRRFEDETYTLVGQENFKGYTSKFDNKTYYQGTPSFIIECKSKRSPWYYSKRVLWVDKKTGGGFYEEKYDPNGKKFMTLFKNFVFYNVNGKEFPMQTIIEGEDLRTGHRSVIINSDIKIDKGLSEEICSERTLSQQRW